MDLDLLIERFGETTMLTAGGLLVGLVFGEEEYLGNDGKPHTSVKAQQARSVEAIRAGVPVPQAKKLNAESAKPAQGFTEAEDDELPF